MKKDTASPSTHKDRDDDYEDNDYTAPSTNKDSLNHGEGEAYKVPEETRVDIDSIKSSLIIELGRWKTNILTDCPDANDQEACEKFLEMNITAVEIHDKYVIKNGSVVITENDIAIVKLSWPIKYSYVAKPVCLPTAENSPSFTEVEVSGFGKF